MLPPPLPSGYWLLRNTLHWLLRNGTLIFVKGVTENLYSILLESEQVALREVVFCDNLNVTFLIYCPVFHCSLLYDSLTSWLIVHSSSGALRAPLSRCRLPSSLKWTYWNIHPTDVIESKSHRDQNDFWLSSVLSIDRHRNPSWMVHIGLFGIYPCQKNHCIVKLLPNESPLFPLHFGHWRLIRGMQLGATASLHNENSAWRPLFTEKCAPRDYPMILLFKFCDQNVGQMYKSRRYLVQKLMNFLNQESKNFRALTVRFFFIILWAPSFLAAPPSTLSWIRPWLWLVSYKKQKKFVQYLMGKRTVSLERSDFLRYF